MNRTKADLTSKQLEIVFRIANSQTRKQVADCIGLSDGCLDWHFDCAVKAIRKVFTVPGPSTTVLVTRYALAMDINGHRYVKSKKCGRPPQRIVHSSGQPTTTGSV